MGSYYPLEFLFWIAFFLSNYFPTNYARLEDTAQPQVTILQGTLLGTTLTTRYGRNISAFLGIPYAQPPVGNLRFANPVAAEGWNGTLDAGVNSNKCPEMLSQVVMGKEDCLYVKVYTPKLPQNTTNSSLLPVMVFIHGGAFKVNTPHHTGAEYLLDADVVLVVPNYRLGPLGFLSTGDEVASGNWGLKDQVLALEWVRDNVHHFGGDPNQVTIFGESAGAASVHHLTLSNLTIGLFNRYITQSGSALGTWAYRPRAAYSSRAFELGEYVGCSNDTSDSLISCLRTVDFSDIIASELRFLVWESFPDIIWGPTDEPDIEGAILVDSPSNLISAGKIRDLPWISGVVRDEGLLHTAAFYKNKDLLFDFLKNINTLLPIMLCWNSQPDSGAAWTNAAKSYYFNDDLTSNTNALLKNLTMLVSDSQFYYPAHKGLVQQHTMAVNPQYFYTFNYRGTYSITYMSDESTMNHGITHTDDLIYLFSRESQFSTLNLTMSETDYRMVDTMVQLWTSFAINGTPTASDSSGAVTWKPFSMDDNYLRIGNDVVPELEVEYSFFKERMEFWANMDTALHSGTGNSSSNIV